MHEGGWKLVKVGDELVFTDPRGREYRRLPPATPVPPDPVPALRDRAESAGVAIDAKTNYPQWNGDTPDYEMCIESVRRLGPRNSQEV